MIILCVIAVVEMFEIAILNIIRIPNITFYYRIDSTPDPRIPSPEECV